jgi:hypothetical protein
MMSDKLNFSPPPISSASLEVDLLVLGTVNAPFKQSISASELAHALSSGNFDRWLVHVATFFTDVRPSLVCNFAEAHGIPPKHLRSVYSKVKKSTGERNPDLEKTFVELARAA